MKVSAKNLSIVFSGLFLIVLFIPPCLPAEPVEAVLFPDSARVWEETRSSIIRQENRGFTELILPAQADPETLSISISQDQTASVTDISWERADPAESHQVALLTDKLEELLKKKTTLKISIAANEKGAAFWENQAGFQAAELSSMEEISRTISSSLEKIYTGIELSGSELEDVNQEIRELERRIDRITGPQNRVWRVVLFLEAPLEMEQVDIEYDYILNNSGWRSFYRLEADPGSRQIVFSWQAEVRQSSGMDWDGVQLSLATREPQREIIPRPIPDWVVRPAMDHVQVSRLAKSADDFEMAAPGVMSFEPAPVLERTGTYSLWKLGRRDLAAGDTPRFTVQEEFWPADFTYLVRPSIDNRAFIRADVRFDEARDLPVGQAVFLLDNTLVGKIPLRLTGNEAILFFGHDPYVSAELVTREKKSGTRGVFTSKQTFLWDFMIRLKNSQPFPVEIRLEEPRPVLRDERISASFEFRPEPDETEETLFVWHLDLNQGMETEIGMRISMEAPEDMDIDWGWRR